MSDERSKESVSVRIAREAVENYIRNGSIIKPPKDVPNYLKGRAGAFVSIKNKKSLRGCIGTIQPTQPDIAHEIVRNATCAATEDPRFQPVSTDELSELVYSVDILGHPEKIKDEGELDPKMYGVIVESGPRRGLLLPNLEGIETTPEQIAIAKRKAGILPDEPVTLYRFKVTRYY